VQCLAGWRRRIAALAAGAGSVLAMAPFFAWPMLWITLPVWVWLIDGAVATCKGKPGWRGNAMLAAGAVGWWFGFGYFLAGLFWIGEAFLVEAETFAVFLPFAVTLVPAGLALFYAAAAALAAPFWRPGFTRVLVLALALSAFEWLRGHVFTGFPWNVLGYALTYPLPLMQSAALIGIYGLTLVAVLMFAAPPVLWTEARVGNSSLRVRSTCVAIALVPLGIMTAFGALRLASNPASRTSDALLRVVQPSVPQREKWRPENQAAIFLDHVALSAGTPTVGAGPTARVTHIIWPEAAMPFLPLEHPELREPLAQMLEPGAYLITGALRSEPAPAGSARPLRFYNSVLVFKPDGTLAALYDKIHLVPFGEYLPFQRLLEAIGLRQLTRMRGGFDAGSKPRPVLHVPGLPAFAPLICYEAIFPGAVIQGSERPGLLVNLTNDGWFGNTTGPRQHLQQARVRAVEEGLPLVRAANNGISAVVDSYGRIVAKLGLNVHGSLDAALPPALQPTLYARYGDTLFALLWLMGAGALVAMLLA
jgi:apolipoprotein N-acyltransferase